MNKNMNIGKSPNVATNTANTETIIIINIENTNASNIKSKFDILIMKF